MSKRVIILLLVTLIGLTISDFTPAYGQFNGYPQTSPANPTANQPITFSVTISNSEVYLVTFSIYPNASLNLCDTGDWLQLSPSLTLHASPNSENVWSATSTAGLPAGLYGLVVYAYYANVGSPMCTVFRVAKPTLPVPESNAIQIVAFMALAASLYLLRRRRNE
ncbi:MAG: hypothetical protein ABSF00_01970 [Candidatus Bathyarchaeia archaeon]|jgi:hypothetical protein